jgi:hypothetical protein
MFILASASRPIVTTDQVYKSHANVKLVCGFYGADHPKCKKAVDDDTQLYIDFLNQFKVSDSDDDNEINGCGGCG